MIKCFLSHSSKDKNSYVRKVAELLRSEAKIFDEETFEAGMSPAEEIVSGLDETSLFVIFISNSALESGWVREEVSNAKVRLDNGLIDRVYPIIIDKDIDYSDVRIPQWMKDGLNIQHIKQPKVAARKINARLREITWRNHPTLKEREKIFVGRNDKTKKVEQRFDDFSKKTPIVFVASGLSYIGRKSFIKNSLKKASIIRDSYELPVIVMDINDSIEDFILKLDDLGYSETKRDTGLFNKELSEKVSTAGELAFDIANEKERVLIEDHGAIVQYDGNIVDWFQDIISVIQSCERLVFCIASRFRPNSRIMYQNDCFYFEELAELDRSERNGLLLRYSKFRELDLSQQDLSFFSDLLTGYPEQVIYTVDSIADSSVYEVKKNSHHIREYAEDKARIVIESLKDDDVKFGFLHFLSRFDFISFEFLFELVEESEYFPVLNGFLLSSICERLGSTGDYIRVNEVVRDFILRSNFGIDDKFSEKLKIHVKNFLSEDASDSRDVSDYMFSIKEALLSGQEIPERLLIPSYFLKTIRTLYERGGSSNYREVIRLSDRVLLNEKYMHRNIVEQVCFVKCQALARLKDSEFFSSVKKVSEPQSSFLHGFFFRLTGEQEKAISSYMRVLNRNPNDYRVKSELVLIYLQSDEYDIAYDIAKEVYEKDSSNPINLNNYLTCIFHKDKNEIDRDAVVEIIERLNSIPSERAREMYCSARAKTFAKLDNDFDSAFTLIENTISNFPDVAYPVLTFADLAIQSRNVDKLKSAISKLDKLESKNSQTYRSYIRYKSIYLAMSGNLPEAIRLSKQELKGVRPKALEIFFEKLHSMCP
ncbi:TIR domain-containing protein [Gallaecimonas pentaromativorans]|uniref:TIR domain-containing protein n=1 Tax=Gallaecimonas pentaromativorans TaxID=584787 RepID=UPI003A8D135F